MTAWIAIGVAAAGIVGGAVVTAMLARARLAQARALAERLLREAREEAADVAVRAEARRTAELSRLEADTAEELETEGRELEDYELEIQAREEVLAAHEQVAADLEAEVEAKEKRAGELNADAERLVEEEERCRERITLKLEETAGLTQEEAAQQLVKERVEKGRLQAQIRTRNAEELLLKEAAGEAERIMSIAVDRHSGAGHLERVQNAIPLPDPRTLAAFADPEGPAHKAFCEEIGCELICDESVGTATVRGDDPLAREVARRVLRQIANRSVQAPEKVRALARQVRTELDREVNNAGRKAAKQLGLKKIDPEILHLVGRLKFRLSYSQNQLKHAIEVAHLAGIMAQELGLDVKLARRGGLLHDIGKAMTHDHDGSHAVLGAEVARRCGEDEITANAIGSHHNDEPPRSAIAHLVTAADAISGARPGARRESVTQYINRIQQIQEIASRPRAVRRVDVMHAGREVRVVVAGEERGAIDESERMGGVVLADHELQPLARGIANDLEQEVTFAGQIKVTVIRESRAVSVAS